MLNKAFSLLGKTFFFSNTVFLIYYPYLFCEILYLIGFDIDIDLDLLGGGGILDLDFQNRITNRSFTKF